MPREPVFYAEDAEGVLRRWYPPADMTMVRELVDAVRRMEEADERYQGEMPVRYISEVYAARAALDA